MNPTAHIDAGIESAVRLLTSKPYYLTAEELDRMQAEVWDGRHIVWSGDPESYKGMPEKAKLSCQVIAVGWAYLRAFGSKTPEEVALAAEWSRLDAMLHSANSRFVTNKAAARTESLENKPAFREAKIYNGCPSTTAAVLEVLLKEKGFEIPYKTAERWLTKIRKSTNK